MTPVANAPCYSPRVVPKIAGFLLKAVLLPSSSPASASLESTVDRTLTSQPILVASDRRMRRQPSFSRRIGTPTVVLRDLRTQNMHAPVQSCGETATDYDGDRLAPERIQVKVPHGPLGSTGTVSYWPVLWAQSQRRGCLIVKRRRQDAEEGESIA